MSMKDVSRWDYVRGIERACEPTVSRGLVGSIKNPTNGLTSGRHESRGQIEGYWQAGHGESPEHEFDHRSYLNRAHARSEC